MYLCQRGCLLVSRFPPVETPKLTTTKIAYLLPPMNKNSNHILNYQQSLALLSFPHALNHRSFSWPHRRMTQNFATSLLSNYKSINPKSYYSFSQPINHPINQDNLNRCSTSCSIPIKKSPQAQAYDVNSNNCTRLNKISKIHFPWGKLIEKSRSADVDLATEFCS